MLTFMDNSTKTSNRNRILFLPVGGATGANERSRFMLICSQHTTAIKFITRLYNSVEMCQFPFFLFTFPSADNATPIYDNNLPKACPTNAKIDFLPSEATLMI